MNSWNSVLYVVKLKCLFLLCNGIGNKTQNFRWAVGLLRNEFEGYLWSPMSAFCPNSMWPSTLKYVTTWRTCYVSPIIKEIWWTKVMYLETNGLQTECERLYECPEGPGHSTTSWTPSLGLSTEIQQNSSWSHTE